MGDEHFAIDLFAGGGGLSLGARAAGLGIVLAIEKDHSAAQTYRLNHPHVPILEQDITEVRPDEIPIFRSPSIIIAGPPCQPFSTSNQKTRTDDNPLNQLLFQPLRFVKYFEPRAVLIENVEGLSIGTRKKYLTKLQGILTKLGYHCQAIRITGAQVGLPQNRTRLFVIATKDRIREVYIRTSGQQPTVRDAISDLPKLENGQCQEFLPYSTNRPPNTQAYYAASCCSATDTWSPETLSIFLSDIVLSRKAEIGGIFRGVKCDPSPM